jgi:hypothetical protein
VRAAVDDIEETYRNSGSGAAWGKFVSLVIHDGPVTEAGVPPASWPPDGPRSAEDSDAGQAPPTPSEKQRADDELFFLRMLKPFTRYEPAVDALRSGPRVVIAVGETSWREVAPRSAGALAERLGMPPATFPGDHAGFMADPVAFAATLRQVLAAAA